MWLHTCVCHCQHTFGGLQVINPCRVRMHSRGNYSSQFVCLSVCYHANCYTVHSQIQNSLAGWHILLW